MKEIPIFPEDAFIDEIPFIYAPFRNYIIEVIPLMLEHIWFLTQQQGSSVQYELQYTGWICRLITLDKRVLHPIDQNEIEGWPELRNQLIENINACKKQAQVPTMTLSCMQLIRPIVEKHFKENYRFPKRPFCCWWYTIHDNDTHLAVHLINAYQPESPFNHMHHFLTTMLNSIEQAIIIHPNIKEVSCGSWLNQLPKFQQLWPESFKCNQKLINEVGGGGPGVWGQYMTVDGQFNIEKASVLRKTGKHPFPLTEARSPVKDVTSHLKKIISGYV